MPVASEIQITVPLPSAHTKVCRKSSSPVRKFTPIAVHTAPAMPITSGREGIHTAITAETFNAAPVPSPTLRYIKGHIIAYMTPRRMKAACIMMAKATKLLNND